MALEQWALNQLENGVQFEDVYRQVIEENDSVAALGLGLSLCLAYPEKSLECALPLVTCPYLWEWDLSRATQDGVGVHSNEIGDWHRYGTHLKAVRNLNNYPHRKLELRNLLVYFVCSSDEDLKNRYTSAIRDFPNASPISYEEEKVHEAHLKALRKSMSFYSEQGDPANFKAGPAPDGKRIMVWNDPPSLQQDEYRARQQELTQLNDFTSVLVWAEEARKTGTVGKQISIQDAVTKAKLWATPGVFDSNEAESFEQKQQRGAIVGAAYVAARHLDAVKAESILEWCRKMFDLATSAKPKPSGRSDRGTVLLMDPLVFATYGYAALLARGREVTHCRAALTALALHPLEGVQSAVFKAASDFASAQLEFYWVLLEVAIAQCIVPDDRIPNHHLSQLDERELEFKEQLFARTQAFLESGTVPELPTIPMPWIKSDIQPKSSSMDTNGYGKNKTVFLYHQAGKALFNAPIAPILSDAEKRAEFLRMVGELMDFTIQQIVPPFAASRNDRHRNTPFTWVFEFSAWCGRLCASLTADEAHHAVLDRVFQQDTKTALLIMQSATQSFMIEAFLRRNEISHDNKTLWSEITDWIFACPEWDSTEDHLHLDQNFTTCALAVLFCVAPDFSPVICGVDPGWPHLSEFVKVLERAVKEFGADQTLYLGVIALMKTGGFDLLPTPALPWVLDIVQRKKADQKFWKANGDDTVELLRKLLDKKGNALGEEDRKRIILISDILTDNGVRGAGFLHQELLRSA